LIDVDSYVPGRSATIERLLRRTLQRSSR